ncbi:MAG: Ig-like domain-containing protein, partial [Candidatus Moranbacteria bacterium]|nr:Ig-like domain-containing protein [Candidatus Moranbacteria bacterium]
MKAQSLLHRGFLISMFVLCAVGVVLFLGSRVDAAENVLTSSGVIENSVPGICSGLNGKIVSAEPAINERCNSGSPSSLLKSSEGWTWKCLGINSSSSQYCKAFFEDDGSKVSISATPSTQTVSTTQVASIASNPTTDLGSQTESSLNVAEPATTATQTNSATSETFQGPDTTTKDSKPIRINKETSVRIETESMQPVSGYDPSIANVQKTQESVANKEVLSSVGEISKLPRSQIVKPLVMVEAKKLVKENNPKISGEKIEKLKVEKIETEKKETGENNVVLSGKGESNSLVTIYIFSDDPFVISLMTDGDGNWSYELDRELADGKHEAYVAVTDESGKII